MKIKNKQIRHNRVARSGSIKYIVIHDTGNRSKGADANAHFNYFNGGNRSSSADVFIDDELCLIVNDYNKYYTWHVGDGRGKYGITNNNSVGIEICINADGDYEKAYANTIEFTKKLMKELDIPASRVVRHYDASRKNCPQSFNQNGWDRWKDFKNKIQNNYDKGELTMNQYEELKKEIAELERELNSLKNPMIYNYIDENSAKIAEDANEALKAAIAKGILKGTESGLNLTEDMIRIHIWNYRLGLYK